MLIARGQRQRKSLALFHIGTSLEVACAGIVDVDGFASRAHEDHPGERVCRRSFGGSSARESGYNSHRAHRLLRRLVVRIRSLR